MKQLGLFDDIDWRDVEVGKQYKYEDKYYVQAEVTILEDTTPPELAVKGNYKSYKIRVDEAHTGCKKGQIMNVGRIVTGEGLYLVGGYKFKPLYGVFDYMTV